MMLSIAGYYRDGVGQDYAMARYYSATAGSFWSPDPGSSSAFTPAAVGASTATLGDPLTWNRFPYASGDPLNLKDPTGAIACDAGDDVGCSADSEDWCDDDLCSCPDETSCGDVGGGGGDCPVDTCVTVTADPVSTQLSTIYDVGAVFTTNSKPGCAGGQCGPILFGGMPSPITGDPNTFIILPRGLGPTMRIFGPGGQPIDIDYHGNHPGVGDPHIHRYLGGKRGPPEPVPPGTNIPERPVVPPGASGPYSPWPRQPTPTLPVFSPPSISPIIVINPCIFPGADRLLPSCRAQTIM